MKRIIAITLVILSIFVGCAKAEPQQPENTSASIQHSESTDEITAGTNEESSSQTASNTQTVTAASSSFTTAGETVTTKPITTLTSNTTAAATEITQTTTQPTTTVHTTVTTAAPTTLSAVTTTVTSGPNAITPATTAQTQNQNKKITVTVFCSCKNAVDYGIRNKDNFSELIPENGIIMNVSVTVEDGSTALDAIKAACQQTSVSVDESRGYIKGIGGLYEKDCGGASGWLYSVNGSFPYTSSDKYIIKANDKIELHYTVKNGDVAKM